MLINEGSLKKIMEFEIGKRLPNEKVGTLFKNIPHNGEDISFWGVAYTGPYGIVAEAIDKLEELINKIQLAKYSEVDTKKINKVHLIKPSFDKNVSLIFDAWKRPGAQFESQILDIFKKHWFWGFTGNFYLPKGKGYIQGGVISQDLPLIVNGQLTMDKKSLIDKLNDAEEFRIKEFPIFISKDRSTRFTPFGYKTGYQNPEDLAVNPGIIAMCLGRKGYETEAAEKLAKIASNYKKNPLFCSLKTVDKDEVRMSAFDNVFDNDSLYISNEINNSPSTGYSFAGYLERVN